MANPRARSSKTLRLRLTAVRVHDGLASLYQQDDLVHMGTSVDNFCAKRYDIRRGTVEMEVDGKERNPSS